MRNYWSCTKFADWLRGTKKPYAETGSGWDTWHDNAKRAHSFRYWLAEEGLDGIQSFLLYPVDKLYAVKYYINNRWITRTHSLTAHPRDIKPGKWVDVGNRLLPCLFNELVDYVEVELAWWHLVWESAEERKKYKAPWWRFGWWNIRVWRCPQAGLDNLEWQRKLVYTEENCEPGSPDIGQPTYQAVNAQEILDLYKWWTEVYPKRADPYDLSGWSAYCDQRREKNGGKFTLDFSDEDENDHAYSRQLLDKLHDIEKQYKDEDTEMMVRLIKIRDSLWT